MNETIAFRRKNLDNIKTIFEARTGAALPRSGEAASPRKWLALAAAVIAIILLPALAVRFPGSYEAFYNLTPVAAQLMKPVKTAGMYDGICLEVDSVEVAGKTAKIFVSLSDTSGSRIDETTELFDYSVKLPGISSFGCEALGYDAASGKRSFCISATAASADAMDGDKLSLTVTRIMSERKETVMELSGVSIEASPETERSGYLKGGWGQTEQPPEDYRTVLKPAFEGFSPVEGVVIRAAGFIDGELHVQASFDEPMENDSHGEIYLLDGEGNILRSPRGVCFSDGDGANIYEYCFDVGAQELENCSLWGRFVQMSFAKSGYWQVTVKLNEN